MYKPSLQRRHESKPYPSDAQLFLLYAGASETLQVPVLVTTSPPKRPAELILDTIRTVSTFAISNQEVFMERCALPPSSGRRKRPKMLLCAEQGQKRIAELDTIIKSSMNPLLSDASPMNALTVCWRITKPSRKRCKFLSQKRKKGCPLSQRTVPVWSSFWSWQGSIPIFLS